MNKKKTVKKVTRKKATKRKTAKKNIDNTTTIENPPEERIDEIVLPATISYKPDATKTGKAIQYTPQLAKRILIEIATCGNTTIKDICVRNGISSEAFHTWKLYSDILTQAYFHAKRHRQDSQLEHIESLSGDLEQFINDMDIDPREKHVRINFLRIRQQHTQWTASKLSPRYQDAGTQVNINIDAGTLRSQAWQQHTAQEVEYKEVNDNKEDTKNDT